MATFRKLPSGKWQAQIRIAGKPSLNSTHPTKEDAQAWAAVNEKQLKKDVLSLSELFDVYLSEVMIRNGKERGGYESIKFKLKTIDRTLKGKSLETLTAEDVAAYKLKRLTEVAGSTVRLEMQLLSRVMRWAASEKGIQCKDVVDGVKLPDAGKPRDKVIEPIEYSMILDRISDKARPIVILAYETAMRRNEILAITPSMINFQKRIIHLNGEFTKNEESRDVPLSKAAVALLQDLCDGRDKTQPLFSLTPYAVTQAFRRAARLANVRGVCFHSLRHTCITRYAEKGFSTVQLMAVSGHKSITMLSRYSHIKAASIVDLMD